MALSEEMKLAIRLTAVDTTKQAFGSLNQQLDGLKRAAITAAAAIASAMAFRDVIDSTRRVGEDIHLLREELGLSGREASQWNVAARVVGLTAADISVSMGALNRKIVEQLPLMDEGKDDFTKWGVAVKNAAGEILPLQDVVGNISARMKELPAGFQRSGLAMDLMGRGGKQMIDLLTIGEERMKEFLRQAEEWGLIMGDKDVDALNEFNQEMRFMGLQFDAIKLAVGRFLIPLISRLLDMFRRGAGVFKAFGDAIRAPLGLIKEVVGRLLKFVEDIKALGFSEALQKLIDDILSKAAELKTGLGKAFEDAGATIEANWPAWREGLGHLWDNVITWINNVAIPGWQQAWATQVVPLGDWIVRMTPVWLTNAGNLIDDLLNWFRTQGFRDIWATFEANIPKLGEWIVNTIPVWISNLGLLLEAVVKWVVGTFIPDLIGALVGVTEKLGEWTLAISLWVVENAPEFVRVGILAAGHILNGLREGLIEAAKKMWEALQTKLGELAESAGLVIPVNIIATMPEWLQALLGGGSILNPANLFPLPRIGHAGGGGGGTPGMIGGPNVSAIGTDTGVAQRGGAFINGIWYPIAPMAHGGAGIATAPTLFMAGEHGAEPFAFGAAAGAGGHMTINIYGDVDSRDRVRELANEVSREIMRSFSLAGNWHYSRNGGFA